VQIALKPASKALGPHRVFKRGKALKGLIADSASKAMQVDVLGACWFDADEHHRSFAPRTSGAPNCCERNDGRDELRLGHEGRPPLNWRERNTLCHRWMPMRGGDKLSMRRHGLERELIRHWDFLRLLHLRTRRALQVRQELELLCRLARPHLQDLQVAHLPADGFQLPAPVSASRVSFSCPSVDHRTAPRHHVGAGRPSMRPQAAGEGGMLRKQKWGLSSLRRWRSLPMHLHMYRDKNRSSHLDLVGEGDNPWTIDLVVVMAAAILVVGFAIAVAALWIR
jgi:hypothetical protein